jgi:hypothetical protein
MISKNNTSGVEADMDIGVSDDDLNRIRDKTFGGEFRDLVDRVTGHGRSGHYEDDAVITEEHLLKKYHNLFYKASNMLQLHKTNTNFNQFDFPKEQLLQEITENITREMELLSLPDFAVLSYDYNSKCITPVLYNIDNSAFDRKNAAIDITEKLFQKITDSRQGMILDKKSIENNNFIEKRFGCSRPIFFLSIKHLSPIADKKISLDDTSVSDFVILMILIDERRKLNIERIYRLLKNKLSLHYIMLMNFILNDSRKNLITDLNLNFLLLEYYYTLFSKISNGIIYYIRCAGIFRMDVFFALKFLHQKLLQAAGDGSMVLRHEKDTLIVFSRKNRESYIKKTVLEFNKLHDDAFPIYSFEYKRNSSFYQFFREYILHTG